MKPADLFKLIQSSISCYDLPTISFKPHQIQCFEYILSGYDLIAALNMNCRTSLIFHLLPDVLPQKNKKNIVLVVCPLSVNIKDKIESLQSQGFSAYSLQRTSDIKYVSLFKQKKAKDSKRKIPLDVVQGDVKLLFGHPESFLCGEGRALMKSKVYQENVVACCFEILWGEELKTDYENHLSAFKAFFPKEPFITLTSIASPQSIQSLKEYMCLQRDCQIIVSRPDTRNIFLNKANRLGNGVESYDKILLPIATALKEKRDSYPMTIIYVKLKYCGYAYRLFEKVLGKDNQYVGSVKSPTTRLFNQFHSLQTVRMKKEIKEELRKCSSNIRVIFAATASGTILDTPFISNVIHIRPLCSLEVYADEIGCAGRHGQSLTATLIFNDADLSEQKKTLDEAIKKYCIKSDQCLREILLQYFGFSIKHMVDRCCSFCNVDDVQNDLPVLQPELPSESFERSLPKEHYDTVKKELHQVIEQWRIDVKENIYLSMFGGTEIDVDIVDKIMIGINEITSEGDLLHKFRIWDEICASKIYSLIDKYAPVQN